MKVASFDIGIKNLAVFVGEKTEENDIGINPLFWKVINVLGEDLQKCCVCQKKAILSIKTVETINWYCKVHDPDKKKRTVSEYSQFLLKRDGKKVTSCGTQELQVKMIQALDNCVDNCYNILDVDTVIIELQPRLNPKMKQLSHTLYAWFLIKGTRINQVKFIAAKNKLKIAHKFCPLLVTDEKKLKGKYNQRKYLAQEFTREIIHARFEDLTKKFDSSSKKDDLSDCFLQCLFYFHSKEIIKKKCLKQKPKTS